MISPIDTALFTLAKLFRHCLEHKTADSFQAELGSTEALSLVDGHDAVSDYIRQGVALLQQYSTPDYISILLDAQLLCIVKESACTAEQIKALAICKHLLVSGLYAQDLEHFMTIAAQACSDGMKPTLFAMFDPYNNLKTNCYQLLPVAPEDKTFASSCAVTTHTIDDKGQI